MPPKLNRSPQPADLRNCRFGFVQQGYLSCLTLLREPSQRLRARTRVRGGLHTGSRLYRIRTPATHRLTATAGREIARLFAFVRCFSGFSASRRVRTALSGSRRFLGVSSATLWV